MMATLGLLAAVSSSFLMRFGNGGEATWTNWGPNHLMVRAFTTDGTNVVAVAPMSEGGNAVAVLDPEGRLLFSCPQAHGTGEREVKAAYARGRYYFVRDGFFAKEDRWKVTLSVHRADNGRVVPFAGGRQFLVLDEKIEGNPQKLTRRFERIRNFRTDEKILLDAWIDDAGLCVETSFGGVKVYDPSDGRFLHTGRPRRRAPLPESIARHVAAPSVGAYDPSKLVRPVAWLTDARGRTWVAEDRWNPKRITCWNADGSLRFEKIGSPAYGAPSAGFDAEEATHWVADNVHWRIDTETGAARPVAVARRENVRVAGIDPARQYRFTRLNGRRFAIGCGMVLTLSEIGDDGAFVDRAFLSTLHFLERACDFQETAPLAAVRARFGVMDEEEKRRRGVLWQDRNGDGAVQVDEIDMTPAGWTFGWNWWGAVAETADIPVFFRDAEGREWRGELTGGDWSFQAAMAARKPIAGPLPAGVETLMEAEYLVDDRGVAYLQREQIVAVDPSGRVLWGVPNPFRGVQGSHDAPFPRPGEMAGVLFGLGSAPLADGRRVLAWQGNHGPVYFLDSTGAFLGSLFKDCRVSELEGPDLIGGEPFGGTFGYDRRNRRYLYQGGGGGYRVYRIDGLDTACAVERPPSVARLVPRPAEVSIPVEGDVRLARWGRTDDEIVLWARRESEDVIFRVEVKDASPWVNNGGDWTSLFKTGDSFNFHFGSQRLLVAPFEGRPCPVLYSFERPPDAAAAPVDFRSPWRTVTVPDVRRTTEVRASVRPLEGGYELTVRLPRTMLPSASSFPCDFGIIFGDAAGRVNLARVYLFNQSTGLVNDVPGEIEPAYGRYGRLSFAAPGAGCGTYPLGPTYDPACGLVYFETADGELTAMTTNGLRKATYAIQKRPSPFPHSPLVLHDGALYFVRNRRLWTLPLNAPDGSAAVRVRTNVGLVNQISCGVRDGRLAAIRHQQRDLVAIDLATGRVEPLGPSADDHVPLLDWTADGGCLFVGRYVRKVAGGRIVERGWPRKLIGDREMGFQLGGRLGDRYCLSTFNGTIRAFDARTFAPAPGVVLGGKSGHFIGRAYVHPELETPGAVCPLDARTFLVGGGAGSVFFLHPDPATGRFEMGRRLVPRKERR